MALGWYIHHHGSGHLHRFLAVQPHLGPVTVLSSLTRPADLDPGVGWVTLPLDVPISPAARAGVEANGLLHWAPTREAGYRGRMAAIAAWIEAAAPDALVVDVSVEVALLGRLLGVPVAWIAQRGRRTDRPHRAAYRVADVVIAPWPVELDTPGSGLEAAGTRLVHVGALSRFDTREPPGATRERRVLVLLGRGGHGLGVDDIETAARATPDWLWEVTGIPGPFRAATAHAHGDDADVWQLLGRAGVVVAAASSNAVAEIAAARRPALVIAQARPFDEQVDQAAALARHGLVESLPGWPAGEAWPALLNRARERPGRRWAAVHDRAAPARLADAVHAVACA